MAIANSTQSSKRSAALHKYSLVPGVQVEISAGEAKNYADMRIQQLAALLEVIALASDCEHSILCEDLRVNANWLASSLANELVELMNIVAADAVHRNT